jgi:hypothetical protein
LLNDNSKLAARIRRHPNPDADSILAAPVYADIGTMAEELRELVVDMQAKVEEKLYAE